MNENSGKLKINIGSSSLVLIFIILCLSVFCLLSISTARNDLALSEKTIDATFEYYKAANAGEDFLKDTDAVLTLALNDGVYDYNYIADKLKGYYDEDTNMIINDIDMANGQALRIELILDCNNDIRYDIVTWKVYNKEDYDIDRSMPVWTGNNL